MNCTFVAFIFLIILSTVCCFITQFGRLRRLGSKLNSESYFRSRDCRKSLGYSVASNTTLPSPCIILVNPALDQNVGSVARAMLNFGVFELRVVNPSCDILSGAARGLASGADEVLENARIFTDLKSCIADLNSVMATTCRLREMNYEILTPSRAAEIVMNSSLDHGLLHQRNKFGILFGCEKDGLTNDEVALSNAVISIPAFNQFASLNLAQSVNIICYEMWKKQTEVAGTAQPDALFCKKSTEPLATHEHLEHLINRVDSSLESIRFFEWYRDMKTKVPTALRNIINRVSIRYTMFAPFYGYSAEYTH